MTSFEQLSAAQKIRAALHRDVQAISQETCHFLGLEISKPAIEIIAELVHKKLFVYGTDLEAFAKHAKRTTINTEDVKLLVRRCPSLKSHLNTLTPTSTVAKEKKRKTIAPVRKSETPKTKETGILTASKQKEPDVFVEKQKGSDIENMNEKQDLVREDDKSKESESTLMDDLIDLTFD